MDESSNSNNSIYLSIDSSLTYSGDSSFNKEDGEDAMRRMGRGFIRCQLQRSHNPHAGGFRFFQNLQNVAEIVDPEIKAIGENVQQNGDVQIDNDPNVDPATNAILDNVQGYGGDLQTNDEAVILREGSTDSSASDKRLRFRHSGEVWPTEGDFNPVAEVDAADQEEKSEGARPRPVISYDRQASEGSLPDVILSISSATEKSPDLGNMDEGKSDFTCSDAKPSDLSNGSALGQIGASSASAAAERKHEIEGRVNDPKAHNVQRQVSFNKQVSVREIDVGIDRLDPLDKDMADGGQDLLEDVFTEFSSDTSNQSSHVTQIRANRTSSANDMRQKYSDRTSGYGTNESSKNSQNCSSESICDTSTETTPSDEIQNSNSHNPEPNGMPMLSIFDRESGTWSSSNPSVQSVVPATCKSGAGTPMLSVINDPSTYGPADVPILSIFNDDSSVVMSPLGRTYSRSVDGAFVSIMPPEVKLCLSPSEGKEIGYRSTDFDKYALDTLLKFQHVQRSNSTPLKQPLSSPQAACLSPNNGRRILTKSQSSPLPSKDNHLTRMRQELFTYYTEDLLVNINANSPTTEYESVMQKIRAAAISDSSSPSPITPLTPLTPIVQQGYVNSGSLKQNQKKFSYHFQTLILCAEGKSIQAKMLQASRCKTKRCALQDCKKGKEIWSRLNHSMQIRLSDVTYANNYLPLIALLDHSLTCDEMRCTMPWCNFLNWRLNLNSSQNSEEINPHQVVKVLTQFAQLPTLRFTSWEGRDETVYKLDSQFPLNTVTEGIDWIAMVRMGTYGGSIMATTTTSLNHWIIKKVRLAHTEDSRLEVYRSLRDHKSPHIVSYLWMKQSQKLLHVCYLCEQGGSLHERLQSCGPLSPESALCNFRQVLEAAIFLHQRQILYLYWSAKNIVLGMNGSQTTYKLCNFSAAVCLTGKYDIEDVENMVPAILLPLELIMGDDKLCIEVDSWGLGCLLTEMLTSQPARQDLIHEERCAILEKLQKDHYPKKPDVRNTSVDQILNSCWKMNPKERMSAASLKVLLNSAP